MQDLAKNKYALPTYATSAAITASGLTSVLLVLSALLFRAKISYAKEAFLGLSQVPLFILSKA